MPPEMPVFVVPSDSTWPTHCDQPMWFRGGEHPKFYCDCGYERPPLPTEVRGGIEYCWRSGECVLPGGHDEPCSWGIDPEDEDD